MKRIFLVFLALTLGVSLFACTENNGNSESGASNTPSSDAGTDITSAPDGSENSESSVESLPADAPASGSVSVVVLGDSIARGYGLANVEKERFSALLAESLSADYADVDVVNYGIDGLTGEELATQLETEMPAEIAACDYVLISIGGNNILGHLTDFPAIAGIMGGIDETIISDYVKYITAADETEKSEYAYVLETINTLLKSVNAAFSGEEFAAMVKSAHENLALEIPRIVAAIKAENPNVQIIFQTVYNPYKDVTVSLPSVTEKAVLSVYGENSVKGLNEVIKSLAPEQGYTVAPVWDAFETAEKKAINAGVNIFTATISVDPHPNANGHKIIADIYYQLIKEN